MSFKRIICRTLAVALVMAASALRAQELDASINESVVTVSKSAAVGTIDLEVTIYQPEGAGPFPVVVINHGKAEGNPRFQGRYRPALAARYFLQRGYLVVVPMRQGFSKSSGSYIGSGCNVEGNGRVQAEDVTVVLDQILRDPHADRDRVLVIGQSHGGWTTLAFGAKGYPGVKGLVNFAGGLRQDSCVDWEGGLARGAATYAEQTRVPSLWFYGENDSYFPPRVSNPMYQRYSHFVADTKLVAFGTFGSDAHAMFGARSGASIWQPEMDKFLRKIDMPAEVRPEFAKYRAANLTPIPPPTQFAPLEVAEKIPFVRDTGREGYRRFLEKMLPRAFAIAPNGAWGWAEGGDDPLKRALDYCNRNGKGLCRLYAVDAEVVWVP